MEKEIKLNEMEIMGISEMPIPISSHFGYFKSEEELKAFIENFQTLEKVKVFTQDFHEAYAKYHLKLTMQYVNMYYDAGYTKFSEYLNIMEFLIKKYKE